MGYYIHKDSKGNPAPSDYKGKIKLIENDGGLIIPTPKNWAEGLVCVVDNGFFAAAAYAYSPLEMDQFKLPDGRPKTWMYYKHAKQVAG